MCTLGAPAGVPLKLNTPATVQLTTTPLAMSLSYVVSLRAENLTGGLWSATVGEGRNWVDKNWVLCLGMFVCVLSFGNDKEQSR